MNTEVPNGSESSEQSEVNSATKEAHPSTTQGLTRMDFSEKSHLGALGGASAVETDTEKI